MNRWKRLLRNDDGPTTVEYALMLALIVLVCVGTLGGFGTGVLNIYTIINGGLP